MDNGLRFDSAAKAELHARTNTATSALWDVVDSREAAGLREVDALQADGWQLQSQQAVAHQFSVIMQMEVSCAGCLFFWRSLQPSC